MDVSASTLSRICRQLNATLLRPLGQGAFKQAFLVKRRGKCYALKVAEVSARLDREVKALKDCNHPNIAKLYDSVVMTDGGVAYWVSVEEYLARGTLEKKLAKGNLRPAQVRLLGTALLGALDHMRALGFVHRDIKPANILFRRANFPVLTDFGIVRILGAPSLTHDFMMLGPGTPLFAAPEQLHNEKSLIDWRTDQFELGLVLAMAALGKHPFQPAGGSQHDAIAAVANRERLGAPVCSELQHHKLSALCRALEPWPIQRYATPGEMVDALKRKE